MILGTAGYMAPEQARGKIVDRRADIWAFGVILFELLTGQRLYHRRDGDRHHRRTSSRASRTGSSFPRTRRSPMRRVLRRCLQKDPRKRLRDIGDAALELREEYEDDGAVAASAAVDGADDGESRSRSGWIGACRPSARLGACDCDLRSMLRTPAAADATAHLVEPASRRRGSISFLRVSSNSHRTGAVSSL